MPTRWLCVHSHPQAERWAAANLQRRGYPTFLPLRTTTRRDRVTHTLVHTVSIPLFPGYLFVRHHSADPWTPIRYCPGVRSLLSANGSPTPCPDGLVEALRQAMDGREAAAASGAAWTPGTPCSLAAGPFSGLSAVVIEVQGELAQIGLVFLGQLRQVSVPITSLIPRT